MSTPPSEDRVDPAEPVPKARKTFGIVWLVPLVALALALWVGWSAWDSRGPLITITFQTATGIEAGKTKLRYRDIDIGQVETVTIGQDLKTVVTTIRAKAEASGLITESSRFWVVRPRLSAGQLSGLETLVSGAYIEVDPGDKTEPKSEFTGLETPPRVRSDTPGHAYVLKAPSLGGLSVGSPVMFRGITVGEITDFDPPTEAAEMTIHFFVRQPYAELVSSESRFWRERGVDFDVSANGVRFSIGNLETLLRGGVVFDSPAGGTAAKEGRSFNLFDSQSDIAEGDITDRVPVISYFDGSVAGLKAGAPVQLRGMQIGSVREIRLEYDAAAKQFRIPVIYDVEPQRIELINGTQTQANEQIATLVDRGLRATLATGNLFTGQMVVSMDFVPDAKPAELGKEGDMLVMPTVPSSLDTLQRSLTDIMQKVSELPIDDLAEQLRATAGAIAGIAGSGDLQKALANVNEVLSRMANLTGNIDRSFGPTLAELQRTVQALGDAARSADSLLGPRSGTRQDLNRLMSELGDTARSVRGLADYLARHPEALLRGKAGGRN